MNNKGSFTGMFVFIIFTLVIMLISVVFIYIGDMTEDRLKGTIGDRTIGGRNVSETIEDTVGGVNVAYDSLPWIAMFLIVAQILGIMIGSYLVTTRPVFFVPYIFLMIIVVVVGVGISNTYETLMNDSTLASTFSEFTASNIVMLNLPYILTIVGFVGAIIMFTQMGKGRHSIGPY